MKMGGGKKKKRCYRTGTGRRKGVVVVKRGRKGRREAWAEVEEAEAEVEVGA